jgi:cytochrome c biogenesis protein CcmG/thiol:disulfide interchange protein DsbE
MTLPIPGLEIDPPKPVQRGLSPGSMVLLVAVFAVIFVVGVQLARRSTTQPFSGPAPDFSMPLYNGNGATFTLSEQRGNIVILNFWGSWCTECRTEMPDLQAISEKYATENVIVVGVNFRDVEREALKFLDEYQVTYLNGIDLGERITTDYNVTGAPETFVIDRAGNIHQFFWGQVTETQLSELLDGLIETESANS